jgi:prepilin peptidase CpaA
MSSTVNQLSLRSSSMPSFIDMTLLAFVCACCAIDVRTRRIPNALSGTAALMGVALNALHGGMPALLWSIGGIVLMIALLLAPFALGGIGGGDVKMMAAVGAFLGPRLAVIGLTAGMMLGGIVMALHLLRLGRLSEKLAALGAMVRSVAITQSVAGLRISPQDHGAISLPYSVPLGLGTLAAVLVGRVLGSPTSF